MATDPYREIIATETAARPPSAPALVADLEHAAEVTDDVLQVARLLDHLAFEAVERNPALADDKVSGGFYSRREYAITQALQFKAIFYATWR